LQESDLISSVYFDNPQLQMYHERIGNSEQGKRGNLIRVRWYGKNPNPTVKVFMERKTNQAANQLEYKIEDTVKERFNVSNANLPSYLKGDWLPKKSSKTEYASAKDIQYEIITKKLVSAMRTVCKRTAFQRGKDQSLRFSLDKNLHMIDETTWKGKSWCRDMTDPLNKSDVIQFPFAVLEVKVSGIATPQWVVDLKNSGLIINAEHFSKFLYGSAMLRTKKN